MRRVTKAGLVNWLRDEQRAGGPRGRIGFAISARMSEPLHAAIQALPEAAWESYGDPHPAEIRECADVPFVPGEKTEKKDLQPLRYVAIRIRKKQGELFEDGSAVRHFAVLSNRWELKPARLIEWHREKAGTIEFVHDVIKNDLGGRRAALEILRSQRRLAALGGDRAQRAPGAEAAGPARGTADGAPQAFALPALQYAGAAGSPCPKTDPARGRRGQVDGGLWAGPAVAARDHLNLPAPKCRRYQRICTPPFLKLPPRVSSSLALHNRRWPPAVSSNRNCTRIPSTGVPSAQLPCELSKPPNTPPLSADWGGIRSDDGDHRESHIVEEILMERHHAGFVKGFMNGARDVMGEERTNSSWLHPRKLPVPRARFGGAIAG